RARAGQGGWGYGSGRAGRGGWQGEAKPCGGEREEGARTPGPATGGARADEGPGVAGGGATGGAAGAPGGAGARAGEAEQGGARLPRPADQPGRGGAAVSVERGQDRGHGRGRGASARRGGARGRQPEDGDARLEVRPRAGAGNRAAAGPQQAVAAGEAE